ncbi:MAG: site-specific integrase [Clostridia bacterium]|nr:site-specific integrase [Clostridia bacterium]
MIKQTKIGLEIDVKAYLKEVKGFYYVILVYKNAAGKRKDKSFPTKLPVRGNKTKAKNMSEQILMDFEIPDEDLFVATLVDDTSAEMKKTISIEISEDALDKINLTDLTKEQIENLLFADYLKLYLPYTRKRKKPIEDTTYASYEGNIKSPIGPYFREQGIKLKDLDARDIQEFYDIQLQRVTANTVIHYHAIIRLALTFARKNGWISENPIDEVDKPEKNHYVGKFYSADELSKVFKLTKDTNLEVPVLMGGFYGLRRSECVGLRWSAIDLTNNVFYINHTVTTPRVNGKLKIVAKDRAKTKSSLRALPLDMAVKERLLVIKERQEMYRKKFKRSYNKEWLDYVMVDELGGLIMPNYVTSAFKRLLTKNDLRPIRFHDLRHTSASLLLNNGVQLKDIQMWLGHSDFATTANIYAHLDASSKTASLAAIAGVVSI